MREKIAVVRTRAGRGEKCAAGRRAIAFRPENTRGSERGSRVWRRGFMSMGVQNQRGNDNPGPGARVKRNRPTESARRQPPYANVLIRLRCSVAVGTASMTFGLVVDAAIAVLSRA